MNIKECFEILELRVDATSDQVKKAYKKLMMAFHPDKVQGNPKLKMVAEKKAKEINMAREELITYLNDRKRIEKQKKILIAGGREGKVSDFINEECRLDNSTGSYHLDVYMAYRLWCTENGFRAVSIDDLEKELNALNIVGSRQNLYGIDSIHWQGIELSETYYDFISDLDNITYPYDSDNDPDYLELKEYSDMDNDDDLGEVVF